MPKFTDFSSYSKDQVILTSGRLIFNAKDDSVFVMSKKDIALSASGDIHINVGAKGSTTSKLIVNSPKIQFGLENKSTKSEPTVKGDSAVKSIESILDEVVKLAEALSKATGQVAGGTATLLSINIAADAFLKNIKSVKTNLKDMKSKTTYTT